MLVLLLVVTVHICAVAADEPAGTVGFGRGEESEILLQILPDEDPAKPLETVVNNLANPNPKPTTEEEIREHANVISTAEKTLSTARETLETSTGKVKNNQEQIAQLIAQYEHTDDPDKANTLKAKIDELKKSSVDETVKINKSEEDIAWHEGKKKFHEEELKKLNIIPPVDAEQIAKRVQDKMSAKQKTEQASMVDHIQFNAIQAKNLAFQNKMLLDRMNVHTGAIATEKKKEELNAQIATLSGEHSATLNEVANAADAQAKEDANAKADRLQEHITRLHSEVNALEPGNEDEDPIMALTPGARTKVLEIREQIKLQKAMMEDKVAKFEEDLGNTQAKVKELEDALGKESDEDERQKIDNELTEWKTSEVDMKQAHETAIAEEQNALEKLEGEHEAMLVGNPADAQKDGESSVTKQINAAEALLAKSKAAAQSTTFAVGFEEAAQHEVDVSQATVLQLTNERNMLEQDIANELSDARAKALQKQLAELEPTLKAAQDRAAKAEKKLDETKLETSQKKQYMVLSDENAKQSMTKLDSEKDEFTDPMEFDDVKLSVEAMMKQLTATEAMTAETLEKYDKKVEAARAKAEAASKAVADAIAEAEKASEEVKKISEDMAGEEEPEIIKQLKAKLDTAKEADEAAQQKVAAEKKKEQDQMLAVLNVDNAALENRKKELEDIKTKLKTSREELITKQQVAQAKMQEAAKDKDNEDGTKEEYEAAQKAVEEMQAHILQLDAQKKVTEEAVKMMSIEDDEKEEKEKEVAAEAGEKAEEDTAENAQAQMVETKAAYTRLKSQNKELLEKNKEFKKNPGMTEEQVQKRMKAFETKMTDDTEAHDAEVERGHATTAEKAAVSRKTRIDKIVAQETKDLTAMKLRLRKLDAITSKVENDATKASLVRNTKEEKEEEEHMVSTLKFHVREETEAFNNAQKYKKILSAAAARHERSLELIKHRKEQVEELAMKAESKRTMEARAETQKEEEEKAGLLGNEIHEAQVSVKELEANNATIKEITEAEGKLNALSDKQQKIVTKAKVDAWQAQKAQIEALKITALEPVQAAKAQSEVLQIRIKSTTKKVDDTQAKLTELNKQKAALSQQMVAVVNIPDEKLKLETQIAKNKGLIEATQEVLKTAKEESKTAWAAGTKKIEEVERLEAKRDDILNHAPDAIRNKVLEHKQAVEKAKAEKAAAAAAKKAKMDEFAVAATVKPEEENEQITKRVSDIVAAAKKTADAAALPAPPPAPEPPSWQWDGPEPENGKPPVPLVDPTKELEKAAQQSKANLAAQKASTTESDKMAKLTAMANKADADEASDKAAVSDLSAKVDATKDGAIKQNAVDSTEKKDATKTVVQANDAAKPPSSLLDSATEFLQKWVWDGPEPKEGTPPVPMYMKVAAQDMSDEKPKPKVPAPPPPPPFGPVEQADEEEKAAKEKLDMVKAATVAAKSRVDELQKLKTGAAGVEDAAKIEKQITSAKKTLDKEKSKLEAAKQAKEVDKMAVAEAKVGAGQEDPKEAIEAVKAEKESMAKSKLAEAKAKVDKADGEKKEAMAKRAEEQQTEDKMKNIEKNSDSPAVKSASQEMEAKEEENGLKDLQDGIQAEKEKKIAQQKQEVEQAEEAKEMSKDEAGAKNAEEEAELAKAAAKQIMNFEGLQYEKATKDSAEAQIQAAKLNAIWHDFDKKSKTTTSSDQRTILKEKVARTKAHEADLMQKSRDDTAAATVATLNQHHTAKELDKALKAAVAAAIANAAAPMTEQEAAAKESEEVSKAETDAETKELEVNTEATARMKKKLSDLQSQRLEEEREAKNVNEQEAAVKKNPMPELPKGVKAPKAIEKAKEEKLAKKGEKLQADQKELAKEEVQVTVELEKKEDKIAEQKKKAAKLSENADTAKREMEKAEQDASQQKYGAEEVLKKSKQESDESAAALVMGKAKQEAEQKLEPPIGNENEESAEETAIDKKITQEKSAVSDIQDKLKSLRTKISTPTLESVEAKGSISAAKAEVKAETKEVKAEEKKEGKAPAADSTAVKAEEKVEAKQEDSAKKEVKAEEKEEAKEEKKAEAAQETTKQDVKADEAATAPKF